MPLPNNFDQHLAPIIRAEQSVLDTHLAFRKARGFGGTSYDALVEAATDFVTGLCEDYLEAVARQRYFNSRRFSRLAADPCLRLNAAQEVADREEFAWQVEKGDRQINQMQDASGNLLQDSYLMDLLEEWEPKLRTLYRRASGFEGLARPTSSLLSSLRSVEMVVGRCAKSSRRRMRGIRGWPKANSSPRTHAWRARARHGDGEPETATECREKALAEGAAMLYSFHPNAQPRRIVP